MGGLDSGEVHIKAYRGTGILDFSRGLSILTGQCVLPHQRIWQKLNKASFVGGKNVDAILIVVFEGVTFVRVAKC